MESMASEVETLQRLNAGYVRAAEHADVAWFDANLAEDFVATNPDGSVVDKAAFLRRIARPYPGSRLESVEPRIQFRPGLALVHSGFRCLLADGRPRSGRYTDIYARRDGRWLCVSAHFNLAPEAA
jgi:ketosteroid isomerase-like protein